MTGDFTGNRNLFSLTTPYIAGMVVLAQTIATAYWVANIISTCYFSCHLPTD